MPRIIVMADTPTDDHQQPVMLTERVSVSDFESHHFQIQLVERLGWAVGDADAVEHSSDQHSEDEPCSAPLDRELSLAQPVS
jgi:hypothetical protein